MSQRQAAEEAVRRIGLRQFREAQPEAWGATRQEAEMFRCRLALLQGFE